MFAQMRQLPAMAPHIPIQDPTLRQTAYEMMLHAFLLNRADHSILLALVKDWPTHLYSVTTLTEAVLHRYQHLLTCGRKSCFLTFLQAVLRLSSQSWHTQAVMLALVFSFAMLERQKCSALSQAGSTTCQCEAQIGTGLTSYLPRLP